MADEERFARFIERSGAFHLNHSKIFIEHYAIPQNLVEVDNIAWKGNVLFVFEGSRGKLDSEKISQIKERFNIFRFNRVGLVAEEGYPNFISIRVFYYNLKTQRLIEVNEKGTIKSTFSYSTAEELIETLRNI